MTVHVVWQTYADNSISRGYWDQGLLEGLFDGSVWKPAGGSTFHHCDSFDELPSDADGAVVVLPARHNALHVEELNCDLARLAWCLLILTGDEESVFPLEAVRHHNLRSWVMSPRPGTKLGDRFLGSGYPPAAAALLPLLKTEAAERKYDWFFAGQVTHVRRRQCAAELTNLPNGVLLQTQGFTQGMPLDEYYRCLASAKVAPCPSGPVSPDSFRLFEALEAGCVPIADARSPVAGEGFWAQIFGDVPFPVIRDWTRLRPVLAETLEEWPKSANQVSSWWQRYKRELAWGLEDDLDALGAVRDRASEVSDRVTVLMPTSPTPVHPSTEDIETVLESIRSRPALADCEIIIMADGERESRPDYQEYLRTLLWKATNEWHNVLVLVYDEYLHQAARTRATLDLVRTPLIFFVEHDTPLVNEIDFDGITRVVLSDEVNLVRLHHEDHVLREHRFLMVDRRTTYVDGVPLRRTVDWSQRPHVAKTSFYRQMLETYIGRGARTFIETVMYGVLREHWRVEAREGWAKFKLWLYTPEGTMQRSIHLDSRRGDPLSPEIFEYDGNPTPWGAPRASAERDD